MALRFVMGATGGNENANKGRKRETCGGGGGGCRRGNTVFSMSCHDNESGRCPYRSILFCDSVPN